MDVSRASKLPRVKGAYMSKQKIVGREGGKEREREREREEREREREREGERERERERERESKNKRYKKE